jgi:DNA-binding response OmpR family regulator
VADQKKILWADDEIDLLRPHVLYLQGRGYDVSTASNGQDALSLARSERFDCVLLDEMMPGLDGLATLAALREIDPSVPVIMVTKSEEEDLMEKAYGARTDDFLTKPVNPSQIVSALKRLLEGDRLQETQLARDFAGEFQRLRALRDERLDHAGWASLYLRMLQWDLSLARVNDRGLRQAHADLVKESNIEFGRYVEDKYFAWVHGEHRPLFSLDVVPRFVAPLVREGRRVMLVIVDCMRLDQWLTIEPLIEPYFGIDRSLIYSILPSATPYSRNAIFSGLFPSEIARRHPNMWQEDAPAERSKNRFERELLELQLEQLKAPVPVRYSKIYTAEESMTIRRQAASLKTAPFTALVFNFLDILAHGRSESEILLELAPDEVALRSVMASWFAHSALFEVLKSAASAGTTVVVTTDHGATLGLRASMVKANRDTSTNLRYKYGKNLVVDKRQAFHIKNPLDAMLPNEGLNKNYIVAKEDYYFVYPTNYHEYERQFRGSFQHGGITLEEMILPCAVLSPR